LGDCFELADLCEEKEVTVQDTLDPVTENKAKMDGKLANLALMEKHGVHVTEVPPHGVRPLTGRWVEVRLPDGSYKMRYTARGYEQQLSGEEDHYAGTPAHGMLRVLLVIAWQLGLAIAFGDSAQAFLQAPLEEEVWLWPPVEAGVAGHLAWRCIKAMPGLKGASQAWGGFATTCLEKFCGVKQSVADPSLYGSGTAKRWILRHADDFAIMEPHETIDGTLELMSDKLLLRGIQRLDTVGSKVRFLGPTYTRLTDGFRIENDESLVNDVINDAGLADAKHFSRTPGAKTKDEADDEETSTPAEHSYYRRQVGRLLHLAPLRTDAQHSIVQLARHVQAPRRRHQRLLKRCVRYIAGTKKVGLYLRPRGTRFKLHGHGDSDWASDRVDRKSCSGGVLFLCGCMVLSFSRMQATQALSSCEAELYALGSLSKELMFLASFMMEQGLISSSDPPTAYSDSSSAVKTACRLGLSKMKHIELRYLAIQQWKSTGRIQIGKVDTSLNSSDFLTKYVNFDIMRRCMSEVGLAE